MTIAEFGFIFENSKNMFGKLLKKVGYSNNYCNAFHIQYC